MAPAQLFGLQVHYSGKVPLQTKLACLKQYVPEELTQSYIQVAANLEPADSIEVGHFGTCYWYLAQTNRGGYVWLQISPDDDRSLSVEEAKALERHLSLHTVQHPAYVRADAYDLETRRHIERNNQARRPWYDGLS